MSSDISTEVRDQGPPELGQDDPKARLNRFHIKITALTFGANFTDGYALGSIGIALTAISPAFGLGAGWEGLLGASALIGIFIGAVFFGWISDRYGRRLIFMVSLGVITVATVAQFFVQGPVELLALRLLIGLAIGADYALGSTLVAEFVPKRFRASTLASLTVMWAVGYVAAFFVGSFIIDMSPDAWRWLLASGAISALIVFILRIGTPESPRWLVTKGRIAEARAISERYLGGGLDIDKIAAENQESPASGGYLELFGPKRIKRTMFGILFYNCQVIPYFAIYTFLPTILGDLGFDGDGFAAGALLNVFLVIGGIAGLWAIAKISRRALTIYTFFIMAAALAVVTVGSGLPIAVVLLAFVVFTFVMSAASNLVSVYPPELFPTELRGAGVGLVNGASRIGSAIGTFLLPVSMVSFGLSATMMALVGILVLGGVISILMAPETANLNIEDCG